MCFFQSSGKWPSGPPASASYNPYARYIARTVLFPVGFVDVPNILVVLAQLRGVVLPEMIFPGLMRAFLWSLRVHRRRRDRDHRGRPENECEKSSFAHVVCLHQRDSTGTGPVSAVEKLERV